jgi:hypothetical protein
MAGFDFEFTYSHVQQPYVDACLRIAKVRAHRLHCTWRTARPDARNVHCRVDGQTRQLDLLGAVLVADLQHVCEGVDGSLAPRRSAALGRGFAEAFLQGRDTSKESKVQQLREVADTSIYFPVFEFADPSIQSENLRARLRVTEDVVTEFGLGRFERVVAMEELHTAIEQTFRELLPNAPDRANWPYLVQHADKMGMLEMRRLSMVIGHKHTSDNLLLGDGINQRRNAAKHRDGDPNDPWIADHWQCLALLLEHLVQRLTAKAGPPPN